MGGLPGNSVLLSNINNSTILVTPVHLHPQLKQSRRIAAELSDVNVSPSPRPHVASFRMEVTVIATGTKVKPGLEEDKD